LTAAAPPTHWALAKPSTAIELPQTLTGTWTTLLTWLPLSRPPLNPVTMLPASVVAELSVVALSVLTAPAPPTL
jgi:hypothetical protein